MAVTIKLANGSQHTVEVPDFSVTVAEFKKQIAEMLEIPASEQRIIMRGKVLKDDAVLSAIGMEDGSVIHVVRSKKSGASASSTNASSTLAASDPTSSPNVQPSTTTPAQPVPAQTAANPYAALMSNFGAPQTQQPVPGAAGFPAAGNLFAGMGMGMGMGGGMGGAVNPTPQQAMELMQNPMMQQMMQQALSNPQFMQYIIQNSPQLAGLQQDQQQAIIEMMRNPYMMQQAMAMMGSLGGTGGAPLATSQAPSTPAVGAGFNPAMFAPPVPQGNPREVYREQLQLLRDMGFPNEEANIAALQQAQGNVQFALERLLGA
ncbi:ubiquitin-like protein [Leishmania donovani]|uniref:Ubiquitin-like_protein_putative/GeneDB:LmjF.36.05 40 n=2 Tax=Leishmania donovani TaxID=5661 RepID=A0A6J8FNC5_LEIDO|nr:ubiquitin-like protein [Leishmania donovani]VDZ49243.1 ubiquitin-like_protein_putative/GeneDB:LmjF.36.0540 [Leishmania donovani]